MNRKQLLENSLTEEKNVASLIETTVAADTKFLKREKRNLEDTVEDLEEQLKQRLSSNTSLDKSTVEVMFTKVKDAKALLATYKEFEETYVN